ncbi:MAG: endonuclease/exonuclease/phosphatase family protein [Planctomycetaceae bacterium]|nr:endonuclease/exonuclease/phosphatase family protein [Planctomycetaceae bacterium]
MKNHTSNGRRAGVVCRGLLLSTLLAVVTLSRAIVRADEPQPGAVSATPAGVSVPASDGKTLKVITYNVQFLPGPGAIANKRKNPLYRAQQAGRLLAQFDLVGLNEVFERKPRDLLLEQLRQAWGANYQDVVIPKPNDERFMGGLAIAGRSEFLQTHHMLFSQASSVKKYGFLADGFAAKGVLHARVWRGGQFPKTEFVDVFVTHLESKEAGVRDVQYRELSDFVRQHADPGHPVIVMGDMNTRGNPSYQEQSDSPYNRMLAIYNEARPERPFQDLWPTLHPGQLGGTNEQESSEIGNRIDYIFVSNPPAGHSQLKPQSVRVNGYLDPKVVALSDHSAVEADFEWVDGQ